MNILPILQKIAICLATIPLHIGDCLTGFQFEDNLSQERFTADNGNLTFRLPRSEHYG